MYALSSANLIPGFIDFDSGICLGTPYVVVFCLNRCR